MDWSQPIDLYCERTDASFWSEPANAVSNVAFLIAAAAAFVRWRRGDRGDWPALTLIGVVTAVGIGSFTFHTVATRGAVLADVVPIAVFIYGYLLLALRRFLDLPCIAAGAIVVAYAAAAQGLSSLAPPRSLMARSVISRHLPRSSWSRPPPRRRLCATASPWRRCCSRSPSRCARSTSRYARRSRSAPISPGTSSMAPCSTFCCALR
jgi:hypothetical protein